jgi:mono/diheme cytochrome c family protein
VRETFARWLTGLIGILVLLAAAAFATVQNYIRPAIQPVERPRETSDAPTLDPDQVARGRTVYDSQGCALCHGIAGAGDQRYPLDGIGSRSSAVELRRMVAPDDGMRSLFPGDAFEMKQMYRDLPDAEMNDLVAFLISLR